MSNTPSNTPSNSANASTSAESSAAPKAPVDAAATALKTSVVAGAHDVTDGVKHLAGDAVGQAKKSAETQIDAGKARAVEGLESIANALRKTGEHLRAEKSEAFNGYLDTAAQKVDAASHYLKDRSFSDVLGDAKKFARREPALFLGGALVAGLVGGRFLKASRPEPSIASTSGGGAPQGQGEGQKPSQGKRNGTVRGQSPRSVQNAPYGNPSQRPNQAGSPGPRQGPMQGRDDRGVSSGSEPNTFKPAPLSNHTEGSVKAREAGEADGANKSSGAV